MKFASLLLAGVAALGSVVVAFPGSEVAASNIDPYPGTAGASATSVSRAASPGASSTRSAATGAATGAATHFISVGKADHKFTPETIEARVGDTVIFQFFPTNHSVARAEYEHPCVGWEKFHENDPGMFFSGFEPVDKILSSPPQFAITINNTDPIFFYCTAPGSCINYQMVGVINPHVPEALQNQKNAASQAAFMLQPGEPFPPEGDPTSTVPGVVVATSTPVSGGSNPSKGHGHGLSTGAIVGIAVGSAVAALLAVLLAWLVRRNRSLKKSLQRTSATVAPSTHHASGVPEPQPFQAGGTLYIPVKPETIRHSGVSSPPPGYAMVDGELGSPQMQQHCAFAEFGGVYQHPAQGQWVHRPYPGTEQKADLDAAYRNATVVQKPVVSGPHEMYAPVEPNLRSP